MIFNWLKKKRRQRILETPFPQSHREILQTSVRHYKYLDPSEKVHLEQLTQVFLAEKQFEGCNDLVITDEIMVVISGQACILLLNLEHDLFAKLETILVYPHTVVTAKMPESVFTTNPAISQTSSPILGQAFMRGPVILVWDAVLHDTKHPERGHNVVYHEFAHIIDMYDGRADGTPLLNGRRDYQTWADICTREYLSLQKISRTGKKTLLDDYGATNEAEFFAVATELFFDKPIKMKKRYRTLYLLLADFYNQDPAQRHQNFKDT